MPDRKLAVLVVDDHEVVREGLRALLRRAPDLRVVGEVGTMAEAVEAADALVPDAILMDLRLPDGSGVDACREILSRHPRIRVIVLTSFPDDEAMMATLLAGAAGYFTKDIGSPDLVRAIRDAVDGRPIVDRALAERVRRGVRRSADALSPQEGRIMALVVDGKTNKEIAAALELSEKTVKNYLSNAFQKLNVTRRSHAAAVFLRGRGRAE